MKLGVKDFMPPQHITWTVLWWLYPLIMRQQYNLSISTYLMCAAQSRLQVPHRVKKELTLNSCDTEHYYVAVSGQVITLCLSLLILQNEDNCHAYAVLNSFNKYCVITKCQAACWVLRIHTTVNKTHKNPRFNRAYIPVELSHRQKSVSNLKTQSNKWGTGLLDKMCVQTLY